MKEEYFANDLAKNSAHLSKLMSAKRDQQSRLMKRSLIGQISEFIDTKE